MSDVLFMAGLFWAPVLASVIGFERDRAARRRRRQVTITETEVDLSWSGFSFWRRRVEGRR